MAILGFRINFSSIPEEVVGTKCKSIVILIILNKKKQKVKTTFIIQFKLLDLLGVAKAANSDQYEMHT